MQIIVIILACYSISKTDRYPFCSILFNKCVQSWQIWQNEVHGEKLECIQIKVVGHTFDMESQQPSHNTESASLNTGCIINILTQLNCVNYVHNGGQ